MLTKIILRGPCVAFPPGGWALVSQKHALRMSNRPQTSVPQWIPGREEPGDLARLAYFFISTSSPSAQARATVEPAFVFPGHFIPAPFFNEGTALVGT